MQFQISIEPGDKSFPANQDQSLLDAALDAGFLLPYGCRDGACGACKGEVLEGDIDQGDVPESVLSDAERTAGMALFCRAKPRSDLRIKPRSVSRAGDIPIRKLPCRVQSLTRVAPDVMVIELKLPASETFAFRAGQYIDFLLADGRRRSFSIANAPEDAGHLELHVRLLPQGHFTTHVFERMKARDILRIEGPLGSFQLDEASDKPVILLAGGTGFAPIKSIVEHAIQAGIKRPFTLYWGSRDQAGLYQRELAEAWEERLPGFRFVPVLSDHDDGWTGRRGLVHHAVMEDLPDLSGHEVYACGAPAMIDAARLDFTTRCGLPAEAFHSDAFTYSSDATS